MSTAKTQRIDPAAKPLQIAELDKALEKTVELARQLRHTNGSSVKPSAYIRLDFNGIMRSSGRWMLACDAVALLCSFVIGGLASWGLHALFAWGDFQNLLTPATAQKFAIYIAFGIISLLWLDSRGHYRQRLPYWEMVGHIAAVALFGMVSSGFLQFALKDNSSRLWIGLSWLLFPVLVFAGRGFLRHHLNRTGRWQIPALIIGNGPTADKTRRALQADRQMGFSLIGTVAPSVLDYLAKPEAWKHMLARHGACHVFMALSGSEIERHHAALKALTRARVPCSIVPPWLGLPSSTLSPHHFMMQDIMLLHDTNRLQLRIPCLLKRLFDIVVASVALTLLSPLFLIVTVAVRRDGGNAFFTQPRVGRQGRLFNCFKFRSMRSDAEALLAQYLATHPEAAEEWRQFQKLKDDVRITRFGSFIRRTSIDELPQLLNVIKGDMSLVGPRPCMPGQEELYDEDFSFYQSVRPGITGPWQVSGRSRLTFKERVSLEAWYVRNWNLWMDVVIMLKTVPTVLGHDQAF